MVYWWRFHHMNCSVDRTKRKLDLHLHKGPLTPKFLFLVNRLPSVSFNMMASV
jgi:hypothetical protein